MRIFATVIATCLVLSSLPAFADGPQDNQFDKVRPVPPAGIEVAPAERESLQRDLDQLAQRIQGLRSSKSPVVTDLLPDVEIFERAVRQALGHDEFFAANEVKAASELLAAGLERATHLAAGQHPWTTQTGLVVRGYVSKLDGTVQPYGLVIPATYQGSPSRLDIWLHGRGEKLSEVAFLDQRRKQIGSIAPAGTIVLHPYGRYCNAFKFAGEVDILEALESVQRRYAIDVDRVAIRGFSMGGAGCWQMAVHYPDLWFAATPGAGFSETPDFLKVFQQEQLAPTPWERTLWRWYDCPGYAANLRHCPTIAYSGELDQQKQAADIMERALAEQNLRLTHLIGPQTKHSIHPASAAAIEQRLADLAARGRVRVPSPLHFTTFTLKYNRQHWVEVNGLTRHWEPAHVDAEILAGNAVRVRTMNVTGLTLRFAAGWCPFDPTQVVRVEINGKTIEGERPGTDLSWEFHWWEGASQPSAAPPQPGLHKVPGLQGPIDDAFMSSFVIVRPTGKGRHAAVDSWVRSELDHTIREWRRQFRGDAIVRDDVAITPADLEKSNLILFGDPSSNSLLAKVIPQLPVQWTAEQLVVGEQSWNAAHHAPVMIYPNPLNPRRYVVLNSGFTYREYDYLNNARQVPRLPDWAVIDLRVPPDSRYPGRVVTADFFDESWGVRPLR